MIRPIVLMLTLICVSFSLTAQVRVSKLVIREKESYDLGQSDILVADTLVMMDSSRLILNKLKHDNFVRAHVVIFGQHCIIDGRGADGKPGRNGRPGNNPIGPCKDGTPGRNGTNGLAGTDGVNLFLYLEHITMKGPLIIDLSGGTGGRGGNGGNGGGGSPGTVHCIGGNGANGGNAGQGGNGANGGKLTLSSKRNPKIQEWVGKKIIVRNNGGAPGEPGKAGYHGPAGLGPSRKNGKDGLPGSDSTGGIAGARGTITFELN
ncbi:MAG TPA: hypothetical protein VGK59_12410 [Ohtaekwangia sp.]